MTNDEHYSICIAFKSPTTDSMQFFRIADFDPDNIEFVPALVGRDIKKSSERLDYPDTLYNLMAEHNYPQRDSDFFLFRWHKDDYEPNKYPTESVYEDSKLFSFPEPREVIICKNISDDEYLRSSLQNGIPFIGRTTKIFYIAYNQENDVFDAICCNRNDFKFEDGLIKLALQTDNVRTALKSLKRVKLKGNDILESPFPETQDRCIYAYPHDLPAEGKVLIRPLSYYAENYVRYLIKEARIASLSKNEKRHLRELIEAAFARPNELTQYLKAPVPKREIEDFLQSVRKLIIAKDDTERKLICRAILDDEEIWQECLDIVEGEAKDELKELEHQKQELQKSIDDLANKDEQLKTNIERLEKQQSDNQVALADLSAKRANLQNNYDLAEKELQENLALRLGLNIALKPSHNEEAAGLALAQSSKIETTTTNDTLIKVLEINLRALGVTSLNDNEEKCLLNLSVGIGASLSATKILAASSDIAFQVADALAIALSGKTASRVFVPADFRSGEAIQNAIGETETVLVLSNIIDAVNEGLLFFLAHHNTQKIIVLPFASHASLSLIAREAWGEIFMLPSEGLVHSQCRENYKRLETINYSFEPIKIVFGDVLDEYNSMRQMLEPAFIPNQPLLLASMVSAAAYNLEDNLDPEKIVSQHLAIASQASAKAKQAIAKWSSDDVGLITLGEMLDEHNT